MNNELEKGKKKGEGGPRLSASLISNLKRERERERESGGGAGRIKGTEIRRENIKNVYVRDSFLNG